MRIGDCGALKSRSKNMRIPRILSTLPAVALAIAISPIQDLQAAAPVSPELRTHAISLRSMRGRLRVKNCHRPCEPGLQHTEKRRGCRAGVSKPKAHLSRARM